MKITCKFSVLGTTFFLTASSFAAVAPAIDPQQIFIATATKTDSYIQQGLVVGGDRDIDDVIVLDMRFARQTQFERWVLDLEGNRLGDPAAISRPPYYHVAMSPESKRITITVWGKPKLAFDAKKILRKAELSRLIQSVDFYPVLEKDRWTFVLNLKEKARLEVFELANPVRVILDLAQASAGK